MSYFDFSGFESSFYYYIKYVLGKRIDNVTKRDLMNAISASTAKFLMDISFETEKRYEKNNAKKLCYFSMEFLTGRLLSNNLLNLGIYDRCSRFLAQKGYNLEELVDEEYHPSLGNGGLGRLAA